MWWRGEILVPQRSVCPVVPWYRARWLLLTGVVLWWVLTCLVGLAVALVKVTLMMVAGVLLIMGFLSHFVGGPRG